MMPIIMIIVPSGLLPSSSSALVIIASTSGFSNTSLSFAPRLSSPASEAIFLFIYCSRYGPSKNVLMATQLVMPPAKPKSPAASTHRATSCPNVLGGGGHVVTSAAVAALSIMPSTITLNVARLLMLPLFRYGRSIPCTLVGDQSGVSASSGMLPELVSWAAVQVCGDLGSASE